RTEPSEPEQVQSASAQQQAQTSQETPWWYHDLDLDIPPPPIAYQGTSNSVTSSPATVDANNCSTPATSMRSTTPPGTPPSLDAILSPVVADDADFGIPLIREEPCIGPLSDSGCKPTEALGLTIDSTPFNYTTSDDTPQAPLTPVVSPHSSNLPMQSASQHLLLEPVISLPVSPSIDDNAPTPTTYDLFQRLSARLHEEMRAMVLLQQQIEEKREIERLRRQVAILKEQRERNMLEIQKNTRILAEKKALLGAVQAAVGDHD
ncbi:hypothetical protein FRB90_006132, partial [Tulasnella sp. 427]